MSLSIVKAQFESFVENLHLQNKLLDCNEWIDTADVVFLLAPTSFLGLSFARPIATALLKKGKQVYLVDDTLKDHSSIASGTQLVGTDAFCNLRIAGNSIAINMANTVFAHGFFEARAKRAGVRVLDVISVLDYFGLPVIYQTAREMRESTLSRLEDYVLLARDLDDELSVLTLGCYLKMRVSKDRKAVLPVLCGLEDEYFSVNPAGKSVSFALGDREVFCDIGAHVGGTIRRLLAATQWRYERIHAFEPDSLNFASLQNGMFEDLPNFHPRNIALSDHKGVMRFSETGTMGSKLDLGGTIQVPVSTLDDEIERATFIKMDVEGHEAKILQGASRIISESKPRMAITGYHYADDLLDIVRLIKKIEPRYTLRLRHHSFYYYDCIVYAEVL